MFVILTSIRDKIIAAYPKQCDSRPFHVELVDNPNDDKNKLANYNNISDMPIDICLKTKWFCLRKAFSLRIGNYPGHKDDLHVTICYFKNGCDDKLGHFRTIVEQIIGMKLH